MAKKETVELIKFTKLCRAIGSIRPHALGYLEMIWRQAAIQLSPVFSNDDIEAIAEWPGDDGVLFAALIKYHWLDDNGDGTVVIHDYWDHAPNWMRGAWSTKYGTQPWAKPMAKDGAKPMAKEGAKPQAKPQAKPPTTYPILSYPIPSHSNLAHRSDPDLPNGGDLVKPQNAPNGAMGGLRSDTERIGDTMARLQATMQTTQATRLAASMAKYRDASERTAWCDWFESCITDYLRDGGDVVDIEELIKRVDDADDPTIRRAKDVGEFRAPGHWLVHEFQALMQARKIRWPTWPEVIVGVDAG